MLASKYTVDAAKSFSLSGIKLVLAMASDYATVQNGAEFFAKGGGRADYCADLAARSGLSRKSVDNKSALAYRIVSDWTDKVANTLIDGAVSAQSVGALADAMRDTLKGEGYGFNEDDVSRYFAANGRTESRKAERDRKEREAVKAAADKAARHEAEKARAADQKADVGQPKMGDKLATDLAAADAAPTATIPEFAPESAPDYSPAVAIVGRVTFTILADGTRNAELSGTVDVDDMRELAAAMLAKVASIEAEAEAAAYLKAA